MADRNVRIAIEIEGREAVNEFEKISNKINSLRETTNQLKEANKDYSNTMKLLRAELAQLAKGTQEYADKKAQIESLKATIRANGEAIKQARLEEAQANIELEATRRNLGLNEMTYKQLRQTVKALAQEVEDLVPGTDAYIAKSEELRKVNARYKEIGNEIRGYQEQQKVFFNVDLVALIDKGVGKIQEFGTEIDTTSRHIINLRREIQVLTGATGNELDKLTVQVEALSTTFGEDFNEVLRAGNALSKEFGVNFEQSFKIIEDSLMNVSAVQRGEILDQMKEYSVQAKEAGLTIDQFAGVLVNASNQGIFSDKGIDVVKEFGIRIREQTTATRDALANAFGAKFTQDLFGKLNSGAITTAQALETIATKLNTTKLTAQQAQTVIADVFGGPGEDAGLNYIKTLTNVSGGLNAVTKDTSGLNKEQKALLEQNKALATEQNNLAKEYKDVATGIDNATKKIQIFTAQGLTATIRSLKELAVWLYENRNALLAIGVAVIAYNAQILIANARTLAFGLASSAINLVRNAWIGLNFVMRMNPIGFVISLFASLVAGLALAYNNFDTFRAVVQGVWNVMSNLGTILQEVATALYNLDFTRAGKAFAKSFNEGFDAEMKRTQETRKKEKQVSDKKQADEEKANAKKQAQEKAKQDKEQEKQRLQELTQQQIEAAKERAEKLKEAQKKYDDANLQSIRNLENIRVSLIEDSLERERQTVMLDAQRKREDLAKQIRETQELEKIGIKVDPNALPNLQKQIELVQQEAQKKLAQVELRQTIRTIDVQESQAKTDLLKSTEGATDGQKIEARKKFNAQMLALQIQRIDAELRTLDRGNTEELIKINTLNAQKMELVQKAKDEDLQGNLTAIEEKYALLRQAEEIKFLEANTDFEEQRRQILDENFKNLKESEEERALAIYEIQKQALNEQLALLEEAGKGKSAQALKLQEELLKNEQNYQKTSVENEKKTAELKKKTQEMAFKTASDLFQLGIELLSADEEARKKNANAIKAFSVAKVLVDLAVEIGGYFANPANTATMGVLGAITAGIATARAALAVRSIFAQQFGKGGVLGKGSFASRLLKNVPSTTKSYGTGGMVRNAGVLQGSSHAQGGLLVFDSRTGNQVAEFEGGEPAMLLSTRTYANNKMLVDKLLEASLHRNGAPVKLAMGGIVGAGNNGLNIAQTTTQNTANLEQKMDLLIATMQQVSADIQTLANTPTRSFVVFDDVKTASEIEDNLISRNSI